MNKIGQFFILLLFKILAAFVSFGIPIWFIYEKIFSGDVVIRPAIDVGIAFVGMFILLIWGGWLKKIFNRKLQSIDTVEELGQVTTTNFILVRLLKSIEYVFPFIVMAFLVKGIAYIWPVGIIYQPFFWLLACLLAGVVIMIIHDGIKHQFVKMNLVSRNLKLQEDTAQLKKKIKVGKKLKVEVK